MAVSKKRDKNVYVPPRSARRNPENPAWLLPTMVSLLLIGLLWILVFYISGGDFPLNVRNWNIGIGFAFMLVGFGLTTRWK